MPTFTLQRLAILTTLAALAIAPAAHAATTSCTTVTSTSKPFTRWNDNNSYVLSPGGNFESTLSGWVTSGSATVQGNESYYVGGAADSRSLALGSNGSATSAPVCIGLDYPSFRFFLRNTAASGQLKVEVLGTGLIGGVRSLLSAYVSGSSSWSPSAPMLILDNLSSLLTLGGMTPVSLRFTAVGGNWQIDDVYVDPYRRG
jgi:hypothetical protein